MKLVLAIVLALCVSVCLGSSHSEAPGTSKIPNADITDFYMFRSYETGRENYVTILANIYPLQSPFGGPNYFSLSTKHFYEINIDNDGDAVADHVFRMMYENKLGGDEGTFLQVDDDLCSDREVSLETTHSGLEVPVGAGPDQLMVGVPLKFISPISTQADEAAGLNWYEYYTVTLDDANVTDTTSGEARLRKVFDYAGTKSFPLYEAYAEDNFIHDVDFPGCSTAGKMFLGQRKESFPVALGKIFDLINLVPTPDGVEECEVNDDLRDKNIITWAIEIPASCLTGSENVIGGWATVSELIHQPNGDHQVGPQVSRLGQPLVNEVVIGLVHKGVFNRADPTLDSNLAFYVTHPTLPYLIDALFRDALQFDDDIAPSNIPREDLVTVFLTGIPGLNQPDSVVASEMLRLNVETAITARANQNSIGVIAGDNAGFPNGRRPGDDVVDIALRVMMGALCVGDFEGAFNCTADQAPVGAVAFTDGAPNSAEFFPATFPYMNTPLPGATADEVSCA